MLCRVGAAPGPRWRGLSGECHGDPMSHKGGPATTPPSDANAFRRLAGSAAEGSTADQAPTRIPRILGRQETAGAVAGKRVSQDLVIVRPRSGMTTVAG